MKQISKIVHQKRFFSGQTNAAQISLILAIVLLLLATLFPSIFHLCASTANSDLVNLNTINLLPGTPGHWLGTNYLGQDILCLACLGARTSLVIGIVSAIAAVAIGAIWGTVSALAGGLVENVMMRIVDVLLSIPTIVLLLVVNVMLSDLAIKVQLPIGFKHVLGITNYSLGYLPLMEVIVVIFASTWMEAARLICAKVKTILLEDYISAATATGVDFWTLILQHLLPNTTHFLLIEATLMVSDAILLEAGLSYLGLGLGPSTPSWGSMLNTAQMGLIQGNWWSALIPGLLITITVLAIQVLGEYFRFQPGFSTTS